MAILPELPELPFLYSNALDSSASVAPSSKDASPSTMFGFGKWINDHLPYGDAFKAYMNKTFPSLSPDVGGSLPTLSFARVSTFAVGLILIAGAIILFKENVSVVNVVTQNARRATRL